MNLLKIMKIKRKPIRQARKLRTEATLRTIASARILW